MYKYQIQKFVYESINKTCITQFHDYYKYTSNAHHMNTRQQNLLYTSIPKTKYGEFSLKHYGAVLWNLLDYSIKQKECLHTFKGALRKSIIDSYNLND